MYVCAYICIHIYLFLEIVVSARRYSSNFQLPDKNSGDISRHILIFGLFLNSYVLIPLILCEPQEMFCGTLCEKHCCKTYHVFPFSNARPAKHSTVTAVAVCHERAGCPCCSSKQTYVTWVILVRVDQTFVIPWTAWLPGRKGMSWVQIKGWLRAARSGDRIWVSGEIFRTHADCPWGLTQPPVQFVLGFFRGC